MALTFTDIRDAADYAERVPQGWTLVMQDRYGVREYSDDRGLVPCGDLLGFFARNGVEPRVTRILNSYYRGDN